MYLSAGFTLCLLGSRQQQQLLSCMQCALLGLVRILQFAVSGCVSRPRVDGRCAIVLHGSWWHLQVPAVLCVAQLAVVLTSPLVRRTHTFLCRACYMAMTP
jgi:hypothetical protein